jgi:hypothetical protein
MSQDEAQQKRDRYRDNLKEKLGREPTDADIGVETMLDCYRAHGANIAELPLPDNPVSLEESVLESKAMSGVLSPQWREFYDWIMGFLLKPTLFIFVLMGSAWWVWDVSQMVWQAGRSNSGFHLSDSVLIALITTSVANFLALVTIIANNLFPNPKQA